MSFIGGVNGQLAGKPILDMNVSKDPLLVVLPHAFALDIVDKPFIVELYRDGVEPIGEDVQVDIRTGSNVSRQHAADQPRPKPPQDSHQAERVDSHFQ